MDLLTKLNPDQQKVVITTQGPVLVLAGAGSGKTRSVIYRTAYLITKLKINPWNILVVTFTNKAARELKNRLENALGISTHSLWVGTFHSVCTRILRYENQYLPFNSNFSIFDSDDQKAIFKKIYKRMNIDIKEFPSAKIRHIISRQKGSLILPKDFFVFNERNFHSETVFKIYEYYQNFLIKNNSLDFDDLLLYTAILLHDNEDIRKKYEQKFKYVMIDEYQDTNYAQFKIVNLIAKNHQNLCVVGDDDQAIYSWRGADIRNILNFERDYKKVIKIKLEQNYRSPQSILDLANDIIKFNKKRHAKKLWTKISSYEKPILIKLENENEEAEFVAEEIIKLKSQNTSLSECVVLYRTNAQSRVFENAFIRKKVKYQIVGGVNFFQRKEIKDIIAYLRILVNPQDSESLLRIINFPPRGIGKKTVSGILDFAAADNLTVFKALSKIEKSGLTSGSVIKIKAFTEKIMKWKTDSEKLPITKLIKRIVKEIDLINYYEYCNDPKNIAREENIQEFIAAAEEFAENFEEETGEQPFLTDYLQNISLQTDMDTVDENEEAVKLMTMHNAKGLEFEHVFIVGLEDGLLPHSKSIEDNRELEEERRLFYVAVTRAQKTVHLCYARTRRTFDTIMHTLPSRFIVEIQDKYLDSVDYSFYNFHKMKRSVKKPQKPVIMDNEKYFKIGQKIAHFKFGNGIILNIEGKGKDAKLTISFANGKLKKIIGSFVKTL